MIREPTRVVDGASSSLSERRRSVAIALLDVAWQHAQVRDEIDRALDQILTDSVSDGAGFVAVLERDFATRLGNDVSTVAVQSGLAAEFLALKALGIGSGDEVITVPNSDIATTAAISHTGARFVLVDVDPGTHNLDPTRLEAAITPRTRAIIPVHLYGLPAEMDAIWPSLAVTDWQSSRTQPSLSAPRTAALRPDVGGCRLLFVRTAEGHGRSR